MMHLSFRSNDVNVLEEAAAVVALFGLDFVCMQNKLLKIVKYVNRES